MEPPSAEKKWRELERRVLEKVGDVIAAVNVASQVDQVVVALYSLAASLFPLDANSFSGSFDEKFRDELLAVEFPSEDERIVWWNIFYKGSAFQSFASFLLYDVTAALGLCLDKMGKEDLDATKDALPTILLGISCRLESPEYLVPKMASSSAFVFSKVIDPKNPLYLDDSCREETIDWEFGKATPIKGPPTAIVLEVNENSDREIPRAMIPVKEIQKNEDNGISKDSIAISVQFNLVDPDEVIDPATLNNDSAFDEDGSDNGSEDSGTSSDSSKPYDLTDDDADLTRKFSQLADVIVALRKSDDAEAVEKALNVTEKLVTASPDELKYMAGDLARTLLMVRCSELTVEGEEASAEEKRQRALIALIVTCPRESLDSLNKLLYSPNVDIGQRTIILDVMTDAAQELESARILKSEQPNSLEHRTSDQPWYVPRNGGPPKAGSWKEIPSAGTPLNWSYLYERELPSKAGQIKRGKTCHWNLRSAVQDSQTELAHNRFPQYAAAFMLPAMQGLTKRGTVLIYWGGILLSWEIHPHAWCMYEVCSNASRSFCFGIPSLGYVTIQVLTFNKCHEYPSACLDISMPLPRNAVHDITDANLELKRPLSSF